MGFLSATFVELVGEKTYALTPTFDVWSASRRRHEEGVYALPSAAVFGKTAQAGAKLWAAASARTGDHE